MTSEKSLYLYNTFTRKKERFQPLDLYHIRMYVCGPTVYSFAHIGNARPVIVFDVVYRVLHMLYPHVVYVRNVTDVDDKINAAAHKEGISIRTLTDRTLAAYQADMHALGALPPTHEPRATDHIPHMIHMIEKLIQKGHAYTHNKHVFFKTASCAQYGALSHKKSEDLRAGARVDISKDKQSPDDFVLWKPAKTDEPGWDSPFGFGRPGWHIECSAMSSTYLGETFDIHGGGIDLVFPHHENEIAQSCAAHENTVMAQVWMHNGHVMVDGSKMSKSRGNILIVHELLKKYAGEVLRYTLLSTHYRQPLNFTESVLNQAKDALDKFYRVVGDHTYEGYHAHDLYEPAQELARFAHEALLDDINTPLYFSMMHQLCALYHKTEDTDAKKSIAHTLYRVGHDLGFFQQDPALWFQQSTQDHALSADAVENLIQERNHARAKRDFKASDHIRNTLLNAGILLEDGPQGTTWRRV